MTTIHCCLHRRHIPKEKKQMKSSKSFRICGIADHILVTGYDSDNTSNDTMLQRVLKVNRKESIKCHIDNC